MGNKSAKRRRNIEKEIGAVEKTLYKDTITTIEELWKIVEDHPEREEETAMRMYNKLFSEHPEYKKYFEELDMRQQYQRLVFMMTTIIKSLRHMSKLEDKMLHLGKRHNKSYGIPAASYEHFVRAMVFAMKETFVDEFTTRVEYCLTTLVLWIAQVMRDSTETEKVIRDMAKHDFSEFPIINDYDAFLQNPKCLEYFHLHLVREFCEENILFYSDATVYRSMDSEMERHVRAQEMLEQYVSWNGATPLNVSFTVRETIIRKANHAQRDLFDEAIHDIRQIMYGHYQSFLGSTTAQVLMASFVYNDDSKLPKSNFSLRLTNKLKPKFKQRFRDHATSEQSPSRSKTKSKSRISILK